MIVSVLLPYNARYQKKAGTHLWFFYKQLEAFSSHLDKVTFMGWEGNFAAPGTLAADCWEKIHRSLWKNFM